MKQIFKFTFFLFILLLICLTVISAQATQTIGVNSHSTMSAGSLLSKVTQEDRSSLLDHNTSSRVPTTSPTHTISLTPAPQIPADNRNIQNEASLLGNSMIKSASSTNTIISKDAAVNIAVRAFDNIIVTNPPIARLSRYRVSTKYVTAWSITIEGIPENVPADSLFVGRAGGTVVMNAQTGEILTIYQWR